MNKRIILLKDLPGAPAGTVSEGDTLFYFGDIQSLCYSCFSISQIKNNPEWFREENPTIYSNQDLIYAYNYGLNGFSYEDLIESIKTKKH